MWSPTVDLAAHKQYSHNSEVLQQVGIQQKSGLQGVKCNIQYSAKALKKAKYYIRKQSFVSTPHQNIRAHHNQCFVGTAALAVLSADRQRWLVGCCNQHSLLQHPQEQRSTSDLYQTTMYTAGHNTNLPPRSLLWILSHLWCRRVS